MRLYEDWAYSSDPIANSYWPTTARAPDHSALEGSTSCDTAIIGGGYSGLNAAIELAQGGQDVVVLEARQIGWGASGRNGGFCCLGGSKVSPSKLIRQVGRDEALRYYQAEREAIGFVRQRLEKQQIAADTHSKGETCLAHSPRAARHLQEEIAQLAELHGVAAHYIPRQDLADRGLNSPEFYGALTTEGGFALNPMKYVSGLARAAADTGVRVFCNSGVATIGKHPDGQHVLKTDHGEVRARNLIIATNGYSADNLPDWLSARYLPVPSAIMVTRPLSEEERANQGWTSRQMCYDSRNLLHYFRLLPDNRMLFGLRAAVRVSPRADKATRARARVDFDRMFPDWRHVETEFFWSGLICMSRNLTPFAGPIPGLENAWATLCYHGNGVAMGSYSGALIANQILNKGPGAPGVMTRPLRRFELGRLRRTLLPAAYAWYEIEDKWG